MGYLRGGPLRFRDARLTDNRQINVAGKLMSARRALPDIDTARCTGCGWCVSACDLHLLSLERQGWNKFSTLHDHDLCTGCADCEATCPFDVITMREERVPCSGASRGTAFAGPLPLHDSDRLQP
jgi:ferredoxin